MLITLGFFALIRTQLEFDLNIVAAVLTIIGYSINDKIVIDDRIRENLRKYRQMPIGELIDLSVNETLPRTVMTSLTIIIALASLLIFGGHVLRGFTAAMILGVIVGTYSSIYVSSSLLITLGIDKSRFKQMNQAVDKKKAARERAERIAPRPLMAKFSPDPVASGPAIRRDFGRWLPDRRSSPSRRRAADARTLRRPGRRRLSRRSTWARWVTCSTANRRPSSCCSAREPRCAARRRPSPRRSMPRG